MFDCTNVYVESSKLIDVPPQLAKAFKGTKKDSSMLSFFCTQSRDRTGTGVTPLVFETNASTNSAIWAQKDCKYNHILLKCNDFQQGRCCYAIWITARFILRNLFSHFFVISSPIRRYLSCRIFEIHRD